MKKKKENENKRKEKNENFEKDSCCHGNFNGGAHAHTTMILKCSHDRYF